MIENDFPVEAIVDKRIVTDPDRLHALLARPQRTDPRPWVAPESYQPFWLGHAPCRHQSDRTRVARAALIGGERHAPPRS